MKTYYQQLFSYEKWANAQVLAHLQLLESLPQRCHEIFSHLIAAQAIWYSRITDTEAALSVWETLPKTEWEGQLQTHQAEWETFLEDCSDGDFLRVVSYQNSQGVSFQNTLGEIVTHLCMHGTYHRGQLNVLIKPIAKALPATDFIFFARKPEQ